MPDLNDMALFVEVAKAMSFRRAAEGLGMPSSTVSRRIDALEKSIGLRLLHRTTRRVELTEAGRLYLERARRIVEEAKIAHEQLGGMLERPSGVLRASFPVDFATQYLTPLIADFAALYPDLTFEFDLAPRNVDLVAEPFDVAIRMGPQPDSQLIARPLATLDLFLFASPDYLAREREPEGPADLASHQCLDFPKISRWRLRRETETAEVAVNARFRLNSRGMIRQLAILGCGIMMLPERFVERDVAERRLRRVLPGWQGMPLPVFAVTETRLLPAKTQVFIDFLRERLRCD